MSLLSGDSQTYTSIYTHIVTLNDSQGHGITQTERCTGIAGAEPASPHYRCETGIFLSVCAHVTSFPLFCVTPSAPMELIYSDSLCLIHRLTSLQPWFYHPGFWVIPITLTLNVISWTVLTSACDLIWRHGPHRGKQGKRGPFGWALLLCNRYYHKKGKCGHRDMLRGKRTWRDTGDVHLQNKEPGLGWVLPPWKKPTPLTDLGCLASRTVRRYIFGASGASLWYFVKTALAN